MPQMEIFHCRFTSVVVYFIKPINYYPRLKGYSTCLRPGTCSTLILNEQISSAVEILLCFSLLPLGEVLSPTGSLSQVKHTPQTPVIGGKSLCVSDLLQSYQTKVGGRHGGWQGVSQVDPVEPAPRPELPKVGLKESVYTDLLFKVQDKVRYICDT